MTENTEKPNIVDMTDCLEAVKSFKSVKNISFLIFFACLLTNLAAFCLNEMGRIVPAGTETLEIATDIENEPTVPTLPIIEPEEIDQAATDPETPGSAEVQPVEDPAPAEQDDKPAQKFTISTECASMTINICNFIAILVAAFFSLTLLICLKISLVGRLGGISHISKAFFLSLFAFILLLPWQNLFAGFIAGAIYAPAELFTSAAASEDTEFAPRLLYFLRFTALPVFVILLTVLAQLRSAKWAKTTLKRCLGQYQ